MKLKEATQLADASKEGVDKAARALSGPQKALAAARTALYDSETMALAEKEVTKTTARALLLARQRLMLAADEFEQARERLDEAEQKSKESSQTIAELEDMLRFPPTESDIFCSGKVDSKSTVAVNFQVPQMRETCNPQAPLESAFARQTLDSLGGGWRGLCTFKFVPSGEQNGP